MKQGSATVFIKFPSVQAECNIEEKCGNQGDVNYNNPVNIYIF